ncbi:hypothetical protein FKW77_006116 [Venturia effusa]|uniref:Uncharacterized protein n=1 Tax=Venturia effusa TaxID=50376 RepID=A0A517L3E7_9PEZI|nr:hypothetical protein FKW77_006116 [Venturia effusa]
MPFDSFNLRAEDLTTVPLTQSKSAPTNSSSSSERPNLFRSITAKASMRSPSRKPSMTKRPTLEQIYSRPGVSRTTTDAAHDMTATEAATKVTLRTKLAGVWSSMTTHFVKAAMCSGRCVAGP